MCSRRALLLMTLMKRLAFKMRHSAGCIAPACYAIAPRSDAELMEARMSTVSDQYRPPRPVDNYATNLSVLEQDVPVIHVNVSKQHMATCAQVQLRAGDCVGRAGHRDAVTQYDAVILLLEILDRIVPVRG